MRHYHLFASFPSRFDLFLYLLLYYQHASNNFNLKWQMMILINTPMLHYMHLCETILNNFLSSLQEAELGICAHSHPPSDFQSCPGVSQGGGRMEFGGRERLWPGVLGRWLADLATLLYELFPALISHAC